MTTTPAFRPTAAYLSLTGAFARWPLFVIAAAAVYVGYGRLAGLSPDTVLMLLAILLPIGAGTGLLATARRGELDMLFGTGTTRARVWSVATVRAAAVPVAATALLVLAGGGRFDTAASAPAVAARAAGTLLFTCGVCFAAGLGEQKSVAGAVWMIARFVAFLIEPFRDVALSLTKPALAPRPPGLVQALVVLVIPELLLTRIEAVFVILFAILGLCALGLSFWRFSRADLGGKRR
jgi:hypothetical protein